MILKKLSDRQNFSYYMVRSLKALHHKQYKIAIGDSIYVMLYPGEYWHLFNSNDESNQYEFNDDAKLGIDFEEIDI